MDIFMQGAKIKDDDFLRGEAIIWINWEEIYQHSIRRPSTSLWSACGFCKYFSLLTYCFARSQHTSLDLFGIM